MTIKGVILGIDSVLLAQDARDHSKEILRLLKYLKLRGLKPAVLANRLWTIEKLPIDEVFDSNGLKLDWFISSRDTSIPKKPTREAVLYVLSRMGWNTNEVLYIGNTDSDMRTAVNANVLFLNAQWYDQGQQYGLKFQNPKDIARFVDIFCLRDHWWHYALKTDGIEFYSLGPYGTREQQYSVISEDAFQAAKKGTGHPDFWIRYLLSTVYFAGLSFDYIAIYPSSNVGGRVTGMEETVQAFGNCFRKSYISDLLIRHTPSIKSAFARARGEPVDHKNQLDTIRLVRNPAKPGGGTYKANPLCPGKTVLVIDDFCTQGNSLEPARVLIEKTGAKTIGLSLLKTLYRGYREINSYSPQTFDPFSPTTFNNVQFLEHSYASGVADAATHEEIGEKLKRYDEWDWPVGI